MHPIIKAARRKGYYIKAVNGKDIVKQAVALANSGNFEAAREKIEGSNLSGRAWTEVEKILDNLGNVDLANAEDAVRSALSVSNALAYNSPALEILQDTRNGDWYSENSEALGEVLTAVQYLQIAWRHWEQAGSLFPSKS